MKIIKSIEKSKKLVIGLTLCFGLVFQNVPVLAISQNAINRINNSTEFYVPSSACNTTSGTVGTAPVSLSQNDQQIFQYFAQNGYTKIQAAGIVGNIVNESGGDPEINQTPRGDYQSPPDPTNSGDGWGIAQWTPPSEILSYATSVNKPAYLLTTQLEFLATQLQTTESLAGSELKSTTTIQDAVAAFEGNSQYGGPYSGYERPQNEQADYLPRLIAAEQALSQYGSTVTDLTQPTPTTGASSSGQTSSSQNSNCSNTTSSSSGSSTSYQNPLRSITNLTASRIDHGVDYTGSGPVYAIGPGTVVDVVSPSSAGWDGGYWINYQLTSGPANGKYVYFAENCTPMVNIGEIVNSNTIICNMINSPPHIETGWAQPPSSGDISMAYTEGAGATNYGQNFSSFLHSLGAPAGNLSLSSQVLNIPLPAGWPTWGN